VSTWEAVDAIAVSTLLLPSAHLVAALANKMPVNLCQNCDLTKHGVLESSRLSPSCHPRTSAFAGLVPQPWSVGTHRYRYYAVLNPLVQRMTRSTPAFSFPAPHWRSVISSATLVEVSCSEKNPGHGGRLQQQWRKRARDQRRVCYLAQWLAV
jgi:hypothetical protein